MSTGRLERGVGAGAPDGMRDVHHGGRRGARGTFLVLHPGGCVLDCGRVTADTFKTEIAEALRTYDRFVVCLEKTPDELERSLQSLVEKAIRAFEGRGAGLRHGIALDRQVTVILSQTEGERPLCGIYFNLSSPYHRQRPSKASSKTREEA